MAEMERKTLKKLVKRLRDAADECENENYHDNCSALHGLAEWISDNKTKDELDLMQGALEFLVIRLENPW